MTADAKPLTRRRMMQLLGAWALGPGLLLVALGAWLWMPLLYVGSSMAGAGVVWLVISPLYSDELVTPRYRRYMRSALLAGGGYVLGMTVLNVAKHHPIPSWVMVLVVVFSALMMGSMVFIEWRALRLLDELERRVLLEAMFIAAGVTGTVTFVVGMLQSFDVIAFRGGMVQVLPLLLVVYVIAAWFCRRKYGLKGIC